ncbi:MAG TPA: hypothetical protein VIY51_17370 [Xanthobacteraceae bacterium]
MSERKPRLDWIRKVLVDLDDQHGRVIMMPRRIALAPEIVPADHSPMDHSRIADHSDAEESSAQLCPSWQLMRLAATRKF